MDLPQSITIQTGEQSQITETIDLFFLDIVNEIRLTHKVKDGDLEIKSGEIAYDPQQVTDDRITFLRYKDRIIAGVLMTRTEFNNVRYTFFRSNEGESL